MPSYSHKTVALYGLMVFLGLIPGPLQASLIYEEDFEYGGPTVIRSENPFLGGWFESNYRFEDWAGNVMTANRRSSDGKMMIQSSAGGVEGVGVIIEPAYEEAGLYSLQYDLTVSNLTSGDPGSFASVRVFTGSGYDLTGRSGDALQFQLHTDPRIVGLGNATASGILAEAAHRESVRSATLSFNYDGISAVAFIFSSHDGGSTPGSGPLLEIDNVSFATAGAVPEPSTVLFLGTMMIFGFIVVKRRRRVAIQHALLDSNQRPPD